MPDFEFEKKALKRGYHLICGIDEAGRGPWAGPVVAAAVILDISNLAQELRNSLDDSKKLNSKTRDALFETIRKKTMVGVGMANVFEIDELNILNATFLAMGRAVEALPERPDYALIDGNKMPQIPCPGEAIVKGDSRSFSIAAASVIAKVTRDQIMGDLDSAYPGYGWARNAGYGTEEHRRAISALGVTPEHRRSFKPIRKILTHGSA